jgi:hypothetical protein
VGSGAGNLNRLNQLQRPRPTAPSAHWGQIVVPVMSVRTSCSQEAAGVGASVFQMLCADGA